MNRLTVLYDGGCDVCVRCADLLASSATLLSLDCLDEHSELAREKYRGVPCLGFEWVFVSDEGEVWIRAEAFVVAMWALRDWRDWSYRLGHAALASVAEQILVSLSANPGDSSGRAFHACRYRF